MFIVPHKDMEKSGSFAEKLSLTPLARSLPRAYVSAFPNAQFIT
jgi:hypothetical protein